MTARFLLPACAGALLVLAAGCEGDRAGSSVAGVRQTKFPGQVTSGGGTSGQVLARNAKPVTEGGYAGGTPGIAGGAGGTTGGAATAGSVQESGQGPSHGTSQPSSMGRPGTTLPPGDMGKPPAPNPSETKGGQAINRDAQPPAAPGR
jgi:hypothetical protein